MDELHSGREAIVVTFERCGGLAMAGLSRFTPRDRMDVSDWREAARVAGYDRMVIHDRDDGDAQEVGNFLSVYRRGESWSRWGFARQGSAVSSWCCLTSMDMGRFDSLGHALSAVLGATPEGIGSMMAPLRPPSAEITQLASRRHCWAGPLGSAA